MNLFLDFVGFNTELSFLYDDNISVMQVEFLGFYKSPKVQKVEKPSSCCIIENYSSNLPCFYLTILVDTFYLIDSYCVKVSYKLVVPKHCERI